ncbi:hypothetical protein HPB47_002558 [Ixodes persulcatus]|uniref:Uncharacterized protein n=1 Tax=Ixodes persulcatus TaxID=34615 RepID=A0AC60PLZ6_IXOPE|nr:hypothetical protein HPB47_002558 [Ixodes persulcatus]
MPQTRMHRHDHSSSSSSSCHGTLSECVFCCVFLTAFSTAAMLNSPPAGNVLSSRAGQQSSLSACQDCALRKLIEDPNSEEYRYARIEFIKQQILKKLRLKEPPNVRIPRSVLPSVLADRGVLLSKGVDDDDDAFATNSRTRDDFYGTMKTAVIFPQNDTHQCMSKGPHPGNCFSFRLTTEISSRSVTHAELWAFKSFDPTLTNHTFVVSELSVDPHQNHQHLRKRIIAFETAPHKSGWFRFNLTQLVTQWAIRRNRLRGLEISCKTCPSGQDGGASLLGTQGDKQPFLVVRTDPRAAPSRTRRSVDCNASVSRCCRESFYVSFREIGWDGWIIQPLGYSANFCKGSCVHDISVNKYHHTTVLQRYLQSRLVSNETLNLSLCCTPSRLSSISLIFVDQDQVVKEKRLPNMVVEACECA